MKKIMSVCALLLVPFVVSAQSEDDSMPRAGKKRGGAERFEHRRGGAPAFARGEWLERLKSEDPEEFDRLQKMRQEDPEAFREEMHARMKKRMVGFVKQRSGKLDSEAKELAQKYGLVESEEEKAVIKAELEKKIYQAFDNRMEGQKKLIAHLEKQLEQLKKQVAEREENRETICRKRLDSLTANPNLRW